MRPALGERSSAIMKNSFDPEPPNARARSSKAAGSDAGRAVDLHALESAARSEGGMYAPPKTVPPVSDYKTLEMRTVDVREPVDPRRSAVTERALRSPPPPPDARSAGATARALAPWIIAFGAAAALVAGGVLLANRAAHRAAPAAGSAAAPALSALAPRTATTAQHSRSSVAPVPPSSNGAHPSSPPTRAVPGSPARPAAAASAGANSPAPHRAPHNQPLF